MTSSFWISPSTATGNNRRIELTGMDLWLSARIDNVFVYPSEIKIDQLRQALARTLSLWPLVAGRTIFENDRHYIIDMCDNSIPLTFVANNDLKEWPCGSNVIVEADNKLFATFIDQVQVTKMFINDPSNEPLLRLKLTYIVQSNEWALGISWYHALGDADACVRFSNALSRFYQEMEPAQPLPIFERRLWREDEAHQSVLRIAKQFQNAKPIDDIAKTSHVQQQDYDPICLHFSSEQLLTLRKLAGDNSITTQDALTAYLILTLNTHCYHDNEERRILHTVTIVNLHGVSDLIAPAGEVSNAMFMMVSDDFDDPYSFSNIAKTIRRSILQSRDCNILEPAIATVDGLMRSNARTKKMADRRLLANELAVNSNFKYDWANLVDFGLTDRCRFYTAGTRALYLRVFHLNPTKTGNEWLPRDRDGAEVAFRLERDLIDKFVHAWQRDLSENFQNIKK